MNWKRLRKAGMYFTVVTVPALTYISLLLFFPNARGWIVLGTVLVVIAGGCWAAAND